MRTRELQRRISRFLPSTNAPGVAGFITYDLVIPSPQQERSDSQWRIDDILIAGGGNPITESAGILYTTPSPVNTGSAPTPPLIPGDYVSALTIGATLKVITLGDIDILAASGNVNGFAQLDFHPVFINPQETLRVAISARFTGAAGEQYMTGYTLSYTLITPR